VGPRAGLDTEASPPNFYSCDPLKMFHELHASPSYKQILHKVQLVSNVLFQLKPAKKCSAYSSDPVSLLSDK
jgi:hypothetical protein